MDSMNFLFVYGSNAALAVLFVVAIAIYLACRGNRHFLPRGWRGWVTFCVAIIFAIPAIAYLIWITPIKTAYPKINQPAPELAFRLVDGGAMHKLDDYKGNVVLLNVWATMCKGCVGEMPDLSRLQQQYAERGVVVVTVSQEAPAKIRNSAAFRSMRGINGFVDGRQKSSPLVACAIALPATYIIDAQGFLREVIVGQHDYDFYEQHTRRYLTAPAVVSTESSLSTEWLLGSQ